MTKLQDLRDAIWMAGPEHFDMCSWYSTHEWTCAGNFPVTPINIDVRDCGTTACAAGHGKVVALEKYGVNLETPQDVGKFYDLDMVWMTDLNEMSVPLFYISSWTRIPFENGTLWNHYVAMKAQGEEEATAQWQAVVDYLNVLIKEQESN